MLAASDLRKFIARDVQENVIFLDDGRIIIKNTDFLNINLGTGTVIIAPYTVLVRISMAYKAQTDFVEWIKNVGNTWLKELDIMDKEQFKKLANLCSNYTMDEMHIQRNEYYREVFQSNARFIKSLSLPSLLTLKIADYKTDHVIRLPDVIVGYHEKVKMVEEEMRG